MPSYQREEKKDNKRRAELKARRASDKFCSYISRSGDNHGILWVLTDLGSSPATTLPPAAQRASIWTDSTQHLQLSPQISLSNILLLPLKHTSHQHVFTHSSHRISIQGSANASYWLVSQVPLGESPYDHTTSSFCTSVELAPYSWWQILLPGGDVVKLPSPMTALKSKCMSSWTGKNIFLGSFF